MCLWGGCCPLTTGVYKHGIVVAIFAAIQSSTMPHHASPPSTTTTFTHNRQSRYGIFPTSQHTPRVRRRQDASKSASHQCCRSLGASTVMLVSSHHSNTSHCTPLEEASMLPACVVRAQNTVVFRSVSTMPACMSGTC